MKKRLIIAGCVCVATLAIRWMSPRPFSIVWQVAMPGLSGEQPSVGQDGTVDAKAEGGLPAFDRNGCPYYNSVPKAVPASWTVDNPL